MAKAKHVVVTGGGRGIGAATARRFKSLGYRVTLMARTRNEIEPLADEIGAYAVRVDVGDPASVEAAFMAAGPVDVLVNNAGMVRPSLVMKTDVRVWEEHLKVNLTGAFLCSLKVLPGMISRKWAGSSTSPASTRSRATPTSPPTAPPRPACWASPGPWPWRSATRA